MDTCSLLEYFQPSFYRFSQESIELAHFAHSKLPLDRYLTCLDVGAGCGIIGLEFYKRRKCLMDFCESQESMVYFLKKNILNSQFDDGEVFQDDWLTSLSFKKKYDVIFSNPPYFFMNESRKSDNESRDRCRRINKYDLILWLNKVHGKLNPNGFFFWTFRDLNFVYEYMDLDKSKWLLTNILKNKKYNLIHFQKV